jgi:hypothetical protein
MDDIPSVMALHDGARWPIGSWVRLAYIGDHSPMDDIPPVTKPETYMRARNQQVTNAIWVMS